MAPNPTLTGFLQRVAGSTGGDTEAFLPAVSTILLDSSQFDVEYDADARPLGSTAIPGIATEGVIRISLRSGAASDVPVTREIAATAPLRIDGGAAADLSANRTLSILAASALNAGSMSSADYAKLAAIGAAAPPGSRTLTAGAGLTGGGDLSADRTFDVVANADGSIVVNANDVQVGVLATDGQHGTRGGGTLHANANGATAGFLTAAHYTLLANATANATASTLMYRDADTKFAAGEGTLTGLRVTGNGYAIINGSCLSFEPETVTSTATITLDGKTGANIKDIVLDENVTFAVPTNFNDGTEITVILEQDAGAPRTATWNGVFVFSTGLSGTLAGNAEGDVDVFRFTLRGSYWICTEHTDHVAP